MQSILPIFSLLFLLVMPLPTQAGAKITTELKNLDDLLLISQDLEDETTVYISINTSDNDQSCFCVCREGTWSCTEIKCDKQNDACVKEKE